MRVMSEETMEAIISFIDQYYCDRHATPSAGEIAVGVGIPRTTAYRYLVEMDRRGMIVYRQAKVRKVVMKIPSFCNGNSSKMSGRDFLCLRCCLSH